MAKWRNWTVEEIEQAIALYIVTPFGKLHNTNPAIVELASRLGRTPSSVALKLVNLASIDETVDRKGMSNASKLDKQVWENVFNRLMRSAAQISDGPDKLATPAFGEKSQAIYEAPNGLGIDVFTIRTARQGQQKFRQMVSANYDHKCAISGISQSELLIAGHISPWAKDAKNRLNPRNGLLLNRLHDRAFEAGLMAFSDEGRIIYSERLEKEARVKLQELELDGFLQPPQKFKPDLRLIQEHRENQFQ
jgi:hypothetical protein